MLNVKEKLTEFLLLPDDDAKEDLLDGYVFDLAQENKNIIIRYLALCGSFFCAVMLFLIFFASLGFLFQPILLLLFAAFLGGLVFSFGKENVLEATRRRGVVWPLLVTFALAFLHLLSDVLSQAGMMSFLMIFISLGAVGFLAYKKHADNPREGSLLQMILFALVAWTFLFCAIHTGQVFSSESTRDAVQRWANDKRARDAQKMSQNMMSCTSEEECARMKQNKNVYYNTYAKEAHEACEYAVADAIPSRFEWTNQAGTEKFQSFAIDTLKETITLVGKTASLINESGAKTPFTYSCIYHTKTKKTAVRLKK